MTDEVSYGHVDGGSWTVSNIATGQYAVRVVSYSNGRRVPATDVVSVSPGGKTLIASSLDSEQSRVSTLHVEGGGPVMVRLKWDREARSRTEIKAVAAKGDRRCG
jgi:hypothetical protein